MVNIIISNKNHDQDIEVWENKELVKKTWGYTLQNAIGKAEILAEYYRDDNGQRARIILNESK